MNWWFTSARRTHVCETGEVEKKKRVSCYQTAYIDFIFKFRSGKGISLSLRLKFSYDDKFVNKKSSSWWLKTVVFDASPPYACNGYTTFSRFILGEKFCLDNHFLPKDKNLCFDYTFWSRIQLIDHLFSSLIILTIFKK